MLFKMIDIVNRLVDAGVYTKEEVKFSVEYSDGEYLVSINDFTARRKILVRALKDIQNEVVQHLEEEGHWLEAGQVEEICL